MNLPETIDSVAQLEELLTRPSPSLIQAITRISSPLLVFGASGKMGPTLCALARRAAEAAGHSLRVIALSRFSDPSQKTWLEAHNVETQSCDLLNRDDTASLPDCENLIYLVGLKFGTQENPALTWAVNTIAPSRVAERYPKARITALSTGNVYPCTPVTSRGATECEPPEPIGEYAGAALARERIFQYYARVQHTPVVLLRLNYAVEMRYGVLVDLAQKIWAGEVIDLASSHFNCIWQGDANDLILRSLPLATSPAAIYNLTGADVLNVRDLAARLASRLERPLLVRGEEGATALLSDSSRLCRELGTPPTPVERMIDWTAHWFRAGGPTLGKPTHFEVRTGKY